MPVAAERVGAVDPRGLDLRLRHVEQAGEVDDHRVARAPEREQDERRLRPGRVEEPQRPADADVRERAVDGPEVGVQRGR